MKNILNKLINKESLAFEESKEMFQSFLNDQVGTVEMASALTAMKMKGESAQELAGAGAALRAKTTQADLGQVVVDTCGTGGDGSGSFNISTATAFVVAGANVLVAKHGNRSVTSKSGSADVLEALGVKVDIEETKALKCLKETGIGFFYAPAIHSSMRAVMPVRKSLGFRTIFNFIGPLCNPVKLSAQLIGVGDPTKLEEMAEAARIMGLERTMIVTSENGLDELTLRGTNRALFVKDNAIEQLTITGTDYGLMQADDTAIKGGSAEINARIMKSVLENEPSAYRDTVILNAGVVLFISEKAKSIQAGVDMAKQSLETGQAMKKLKDLCDISHRVAMDRSDEMAGV